MISLSFRYRSLFLLMVIGCCPPAPTTSSLSKWAIATSTYEIASTYPINKIHTFGSACGMRIHPVTGSRTMHHGQDLPCRHGTPIRSGASVEVTRSEHSSTEGHMVEIVHYATETVHTRYLQLYRRHVRVEETVLKGQRID